MSATPITKVQQRRQHILNVATDIFCELGYEGASMSAIAAKAGGSKGTLYNYFSSKDELLLASVLEGADEFKADVMTGLNLNQPLKPLLHHIVNRIVHKVYVEPRTVKLLRVVISVGDRSDVGQRFFNVLGDGIWIKVRQLLKSKINEGQFSNNDPDIMSAYLRGLCEVDLMRLLMGAMPNLTPQQAEDRTKAIIHSFFLMYQR